MSYPELLLVSIGLAMDAFAVSICKGLSLKKMDYKGAALCGVYFGAFQVMMPLIGFFLASSFRRAIEEYDHWVAFILLVVIGIGMIRESGKEEKQNSDFGFKAMIPLAVATSIDALAVGISFAVLKVNLPIALLFIGIITFCISFAGVRIGNLFGAKYKKGSEIAGGIILIGIGVKILLEHLGIF